MSSQSERLVTIGTNTSSSSDLDHINKLPIELLGNIATLLSSLEPRSVWKFASTCRYWRIAALSTPKAWSYLYLDSETLNRSGTNGEETGFKIPNTQLWLERAGYSLLEVVMESRDAIIRLLEYPLFPWNRVRGLHFGSLPENFDDVLSIVSFNALEALSIENRTSFSIPTYTSPKNFTTIASTFLGLRPAGVDVVLGLKRGPNNALPLINLRHLALFNVELDSASSVSFSQLGRLQFLKLINCMPKGCFLIDLIKSVRRSLTSLLLDLPVEAPVFPESNFELLTALVELPHLTEVSITVICRWGYYSRRLCNLLDHLSCPSLTHLTVDGSLISPSTNYKVNFPKLKRLYVESWATFGTVRVLKVLPNLDRDLSTLTHLTHYYTHRANNSSLIWMMIQNPLLGQRLESLRFITVEEDISKTLLEQLNKSRRTGTKNEKGDGKGPIALDSEAKERHDFARMLVLSSNTDSKDFMTITPWDTTLWWTRDTLWHN